MIRIIVSQRNIGAAAQAQEQALGLALLGQQADPDVRLYCILGRSQRDAPAVDLEAA